MIFFLSSSFADMQVERDFMMFEVMPAFRRIAAEHGDYAAHLDLRWGIQSWNISEKEISMRILDTCKRAIDDSRPYIIIFLSKRYGSTDLTPDGKSVTEFEIDHALKEKSRIIICIRNISKGDIPKKFWNVYFDQEEKIEALCDDLRQKYSQNVIEYTATWQGDKFGNFLTKEGQSLKKALLEKMEALCMEDWKITETLNWQAQELLMHIRLYRRKAKEFFGREEKLSMMMKSLTQSNVLFIEGETGVGKTTICSKIATELNQRAFVCCIFAGTTMRTSTALDILKLMVFFLEELLNQSHETFAEKYDRWKIYFTEILIPKLAQAGQQIYFVLDGVNQLRDDSHRNELDFLPMHSTGNVHFLISYATNSDFNLPIAFWNPIAEIKKDGLFDLSENKLLEKSKEVVQSSQAKFDKDFPREIVKIIFDVPPEVVNNLTQDELYQIFNQSILNVKEKISEDNNSSFKYLRLEALEPFEVSAIMEGILSLSGRELFYQTAATINAKENSNNTLYLRFIATLLNLISSRELEKLKQPSDIVGLTVSWINDLPDSPTEAANYVLNKAAGLLCSNPNETIRAFRVIAASRNGLRLSDLQKIFGKNFRQVDFTLLQNYLSDFFMVLTDGRITFAHSVIKAGIKVDPNFEFANLVSTHIQSLPISDPLRAEEIFYYAQCTENYELVARLCGEAWSKKNPQLKQRLTYSIFQEIFSDGGTFFADLLDNHLQDLSCKDVGGIWLFFVGDKLIQNEFHGSLSKHETFLRILRGISGNWKYFQQAFEEFGLEHTVFDYYLVVMLQAQYSFLIGEIDISSKLCREIIGWSEKHGELKNFPDTAAEFCKMTYNAYRILRLIAYSIRNNDLYLLEREFYWSKLMFEKNPTKRIEFTLTELRCLIAEKKYSTNVISSNEFLTELMNAYNFIRKYLQKYPVDEQLLSIMVNVCITTTNLALHLYPKHVDRIIFWAQKTKIYARKWLSLNYNNPDVLRIVGKAWRLLRNVAIVQKDSATLYEYTRESIEMYTRLYATNPTWRHLRLVIENLTEFGDTYKKLGILNNVLICYEMAMTYVRIGENCFPEYHLQLDKLKKIIQCKLEKI